MKKLLAFLSFLSLSLMMIIKASCAANDDVPSEVLDKATESYKTAVEFANTHLENYNLTEKLDSSKMFAGDGMAIAFLPKIQESDIGKKMTELAYTDNSWLFTADTENDQLVFFAIKEEDSKAELYFYGGYAYYFGKIRNLAQKYAEQNDMSFDSKVYQITNQYFFILSNTKGNEYVIPASQKYYKEEGEICAIESSKFIENIYNDTKDSVDGERGYICEPATDIVLSLSNNNTSLKKAGLNSAIIYAAAIILITAIIIVFCKNTPSKKSS